MEGITVNLFILYMSPYGKEVIWLLVPSSYPPQAVTPLPGTSVNNKNMR